MADVGIRDAYRFGPFHLDLGEHRLSRGGVVIRSDLVMEAEAHLLFEDDPKGGRPRPIEKAERYRR